MTVFSPTPPPLPPVFSLSVSKREVYSTAAMLMRISFCLNSLPVRGIRTDTHKCQTYFTLTRSRAFVCVHVCELWLVFISMLQLRRFTDLDKWSVIGLFTLCERPDSPICYTRLHQPVHSMPTLPSSANLENQTDTDCRSFFGTVEGRVKIPQNTF